MLDANRLLNWTIPEIRQTYTAKDTILYALGIGFGGRADDRDELKCLREVFSPLAMETRRNSTGVVVGRKTPCQDRSTELRFVSLEHAITAPLCTRQLADLGARVIKVERPGSGDFRVGRWVAVR